MTGGNEQGRIARERPAARTSTGAVVVLTAAQRSQLVEHARNAYPEECCGILIGVRGNSSVVCSVHAARNREAVRTRDRYEIDPRQILKLDHAADSEGREIIGFYHSHPDHPPVPSPTDGEFAWQGYVYLIVAVTEGGETELRAWSYEEEQRRFRECPIELSDGPCSTRTGACRQSSALRR